jgi:hypothetical protein
MELREFGIRDTIQGVLKPFVRIDAVLLTTIPLPKRFGLRPPFSREYILDSKWFGIPNHFVVGIAMKLYIMAARWAASCPPAKR